MSEVLCRLPFSVLFEAKGIKRGLGQWQAIILLDMYSHFDCFLGHVLLLLADVMNCCIGNLCV